MLSKNYFIRQAQTLLKFARETRDPAFAAVLIDKAAHLNEKVEELSPPKMDISPQAPDVETSKLGQVLSLAGKRHWAPNPMP